MAFASQMPPPSVAPAPLWNKELSGGAGGAAGERPRSARDAADAGPVRGRRYPRHLHPSHRSPARCAPSGWGSGALALASPSGSEESNSPTELNSNRRLGDKPPLMKRLALGLSGALLTPPAGDDATPLVSDAPASSSQRACSGGYVNEAAAEAEARTRHSNREPALQRHLHPHDNDTDADCNKHHTLNNWSSASSSGACTCAAAENGVNNNNNNNNGAPRAAEAELRRAPWFQAGIPREIALEVLAGQPVGAFMVRCSTTQAGCYALSVRVPRDFQPGGIAHYLILRTAKGYKIKGFTKEFPTLSALVTHHSVMPELLPCPLWLARYGPGRDRRRLDDLADTDYTALADFRRMMCELDV